MSTSKQTISKNEKLNVCTVCPRSSDPFYVVFNYIKWVTTSWTDGMYYINII